MNTWLNAADEANVVVLTVLVNNIAAEELLIPSSHICTVDIMIEFKRLGKHQIELGTVFRDFFLETID